MTTNIVLTGAMGSGKSTVLKLLKQRGFITVEEPARPILAEQRSIEGEGVPEKDPKLFTQLLLSRAIYQYKMMQDNNFSFCNLSKSRRKPLRFMARI